MKSTYVAASVSVVLMTYTMAGTAIAADDIVGLKIGVVPDEARQLLLRVNPKFKIAESREGSWQALVINANSDDERIVMKFTSTQPRAFFIGRSVAFAPGQRPTKEELRKSLASKYGNPTSSEVGRPWGDTFIWSSSKPAAVGDQSRSGIRGCAAFPTGQQQWTAGSEGAPFFFVQTSPECIRLINAMSGSAFNENPAIAASLGISITDYSLARSDPMHPDNVSASAERRRIEEAQKNKPRL